MKHITRDHPDAAREGSRSLISFGLTLYAVRVAAPSTTVVDPLAIAVDVGISSAGLSLQGVSSSGMAYGGQDATTLATATVERNTRTSTMDFRDFAQQVDAIIKANSAAQVIPFAEAIAEEVLRQQQQHLTQQRGTCVFRELWKEHRNEANMVRDVGLAYRDNDANERQVVGVCGTLLPRPFLAGRTRHSNVIKEVHGPAKIRSDTGAGGRAGQL